MIFVYIVSYLPYAMVGLGFVLVERWLGSTAATLIGLLAVMAYVDVKTDQLRSKLGLDDFDADSN